MTAEATLRIAIACGGTGGHLFPGAAVGRALLARGCSVTLLVSQKEVDRRALAGLGWPHASASLPAVGLSGFNYPRFAWGLLRAGLAARRLFRAARPDVVLAMGGFTSAPAALAGRWLGAAALLHESNVIPGRANRWLAPWVDEVMVGFSEAGTKLRNRSVSATGTPVRPAIGVPKPDEARRRLGLEPDRPVLLVMGGSQGASALNRLAPGIFRAARELDPSLQFAHLCGRRDESTARSAAAGLGAPCRVEPFTDSIEDWLAAASVAVSRAGASSLAEFAAARLPSILIPYPAAADNHQWHNARVFATANAAELCAEANATAPDLARRVVHILQSPARRERMTLALAELHTPGAADAIADRTMAGGLRRRKTPPSPAPRRNQWSPLRAGEKGWTIP